MGRYIAKVYAGDNLWTDRIFGPVERFVFKISRINVAKEMNWKQHLFALLTINMVWFFWGMFCLLNQGWLPLNPDHIPSMSPDLAFNTSISFITNCNLQDYSGETGASYFSQVFCFQFLQFVSVATGMAAAAVVFNALKDRTTDKLGNFYNYFFKSCTRILLPFCILIATIHLFHGTPMTFKGMDTVTTVQGDTMHISRGPVAALVAIKHLGNNGGGFFGANSAHPLENPDYLTNMVQMIAQMLLPFAMIFAFGFYTNRKKLSWVFFSVMTLGFLLLVIPTVNAELGGNPMIAHMNIGQPGWQYGGQGSSLWCYRLCILEHRDHGHIYRVCQCHATIASCHCRV